MTTATTSSGPRTAILPDGTWRVDPARSHVGFHVKRRGAGVLHGGFAGFDGAVFTGPHGTSAQGSVRVGSVDTGNEERDEHLCAHSFFDAEAFPRMTFRTTGVEPAADGSWTIDGELTMHGRTRPVELHAVAEDGAADGRARLRVSGELDRRDFGLTWSRVIELTGAVAMEIGIDLELELERERG